MSKCVVIGGGTMGRQIAMNTAIHGYEVAVVETYAPAFAAVSAWIDEYLAGRIAKGKMTEEQVAAVKARLSVTDSYEVGCKDAEVAIEAIIEDKEAKRACLKKVSELVPESCIIGTNSSFMVSSTFKNDVKNPERLMNMHYFAPALVMKLVEVVKGEHTSAAAAEKAVAFCTATGKNPALLQKEEDGFIVNNILKVIKEEAYRLVNTGVASFEDVDKAVKGGLNHPMGPFELDDLSGLDVRYGVLSRRLEETGVKSEGFEMIEERVKAGRLGKKTKHGFYDYE